MAIQAFYFLQRISESLAREINQIAPINCIDGISHGIQPMK